MAISRSSSISCVDLLGGAAFADDDFRLDADRLAHRLGDLGENGFGLLAGFGPHDALDADPLLEIAVGDHIEQHQAAIGILGAQAGIVNGAATFGRIVDHRHELAAVTFKSRESF